MLLAKMSEIILIGIFLLSAVIDLALFFVGLGFMNVSLVWRAGMDHL